MTIHNVAKADAAHSTAHTEAQDKLTDLETLVAVRKSLNGSHLPLADLDQIIAKTIEKIQQDVIAGNSSGNPSRMLGQLNGIRTDLMAIYFDVINLESLMQHIIARVGDEMKIDRKVPVLPKMAIPLVMYTMSSLVFKSKQPQVPLQLVLTTEEDVVFSLFQGGRNLYELGNAFGFKRDDISAIYWAESSNIIRLHFQVSADHIFNRRAVFLEMMDEPGARCFLDAMGSNRDRVLFKCETSTKIMESYYNRPL
ncbi:MAG: hypothetical protein Q9180_005312 [Flavoplaca navasiana]